MQHFDSGMRKGHEGRPELFLDQDTSKMYLMCRNCHKWLTMDQMKEDCSNKLPKSEYQNWTDAYSNYDLEELKRVIKKTI